MKNEYPGVDIQTGPGGHLYYASLGDGQGGPGTIHRIAYFSGNQPPVARLTVSKDWGEYPDGSLGLESQYDAGGSTDADGEALTYAWDLDEDGAFDDGTGVTQTTTFHDEDNHRIAVRVRDGQEASSVARVTVYPGDRPPVPEISEPQPSLLWKVGQAIHFAGTAQDPDELSGTLPATSLDWSWRLFHCRRRAATPTRCGRSPRSARERSSPQITSTRRTSS